MISFSKRWATKLPFVFAVQLICLLIMAVVEFLNMTNGCFLQMNLHLLTNAGIVLSLLGFWAITLWKTPRSVLRRNAILGIVMVLWFLIVEMNRRINNNPLQSLTIFVAVYLIALPFASITQDQNRQVGIRLASGIYIAAALFLLAFGLILLVNGDFSGALRSQVYWDGPRLFVIHHPNITSRIFMIAVALCMGFFGKARKRWVKILMLLATILLFAAIALTNCRAVILVTCFILGGNAFFLICNNNRKRILLGAVAAVMVAVALFLSSNWLYQWNLSRLVSQSTMQTAQEQVSVLEASDSDMADSTYEVILPEETPLDADPEWSMAGNGNSGQGTLLSDLPTLNGRSRIWAAVFQKIQDDPAILLRGTIDTRLVLHNMHTHNAWLEALIVLGLPGFILVLLFTWEAAWGSLCLLWHTGIGMFEKNIALLMLSSMVASLLEPSLFATYLEWDFFNFFFFLCLGYLTLWKKQLFSKK